MSDLTKKKEAVEWVTSWKAYYRGRPDGVLRLARKLSNVAAEQRANLRAWRYPPRGYEESVRYLEHEAVEVMMDYTLRSFLIPAACCRCGSVFELNDPPHACAVSS